MQTSDEQPSNSDNRRVRKASPDASQLPPPERSDAPRPREALSSEPSTAPSKALDEVRAQLPFKPAIGESKAAFEACLCYLDIGANRSCGEVARRMGVSWSATRLWSGKFKWKERMAAYHEQLLRARMEVDMAVKS